MKAVTEFLGERGAAAGPAGLTRHPTLRRRLRRMARGFWRGLREWCGDAAYEQYLKSRAEHPCANRTLTEKEFYVEQLNRRYSRPNRCC